MSIKINRPHHDDTYYTVVYNSPNASKRKCLEFFENWCDEIELTKNHIITGDFNIDLLKSDCNAIKMCEIIDFAGMKQLVNEPTRITKDSRTKIDLVI